MKTRYICILIFLNLIFTTTFVHATIFEEIDNNNVLIKSSNNQIFLGSASIIGEGNGSVLHATVENNVIIKLDSSPSIIDFYINYEMSCNGQTDEGIITLTIFLNDDNNSFNLVQTPTSKNGSLVIENIEINYQDSMVFRIDVVYGSLIPLYSNTTSATGAAVISKSNQILKKVFSPKTINLENKYIENQEKNFDKSEVTHIDVLLMKIFSHIKQIRFHKDIFL